MSAKIGEQPPPARCQQKQGGPPGEARRIDHLPAVNEPVIGEEAQTHLGGTEAVKEELLDLESGEVAVVVEGLKDGDIALGHGAEEAGGFFLGEEGARVLAKIAKNDGTTMYGSPSRG